MTHPNQTFRGRRSFLILLATAWVAGCRTQPPPVPAFPETDVKPGINQEFLNPDLNVTQWVERFEKEGREIYDRRDEIVAAARVRRGEAVADIGAGTGLFTELFARAVGPRGKVYAVDIAPQFLTYIAQRSAAAGLRNVQTVLGTEHSTELPRRSIDCAFLCDVYHHFEYPQHTLASIRRALRPGGTLLLVEFKRIPGQSSAWTLNHIRAGEEVFTAEIESAGFKKIAEEHFLKDSYVLRFRKTRR
ncbi:MAG: methyltransferase domain-containing protein [Verrucomicrobia bacterium]|nr:methyltransferase domain-containing protein [Verrucomicrobiota bacterium]